MNRILVPYHSWYWWQQKLVVGDRDVLLLWLEWDTVNTSNLYLFLIAATLVALNLYHIILPSSRQFLMLYQKVLVYSNKNSNN